jgi:hypothetical protein
MGFCGGSYESFTVDIAEHVKERCVGAKEITCNNLLITAVMVCVSRVW